MYMIVYKYACLYNWYRFYTLLYKHVYYSAKFATDMEFLREVYWDGVIKPHSLSHDSYFCDKYNDTLVQPFPTPRNSLYEHVGQVSFISINVVYTMYLLVCFNKIVCLYHFWLYIFLYSYIINYYIYLGIWLSGTTVYRGNSKEYKRKSMYYYNQEEEVVVVVVIILGSLRK